MRGARISLIPQDPTSSLNPVQTIGTQVAEILTIHGKASHRAVQAQVVELLARVGLSQPQLRATQYPHELSGAMRQRVLIAIAVALQPDLIIADEPTSALYVTVQKRILDLIGTSRAEHDTAVLLVTHDLGVAADRASRIIISRADIQEQGATATILANPQNAYTRRLLADALAFRSAPHRPARSRMEAPAIVVQHLVHDFPLVGTRGTYRTVDDVSFQVERGTTHAIVGKSGSGKTTIIRDIAGFQMPTGGRVVVAATDVASLRGAARREFRRGIQLVYQTPFSSLDPRQSVCHIIEEPLLNFTARPRGDRARRVQALAERVGLAPELPTRRPQALSGGQRQRVAIA